MTGHWEGDLVHTRKDGARPTVASGWAWGPDDAGGLIHDDVCLFLARRRPRE